MLEMEEIISTLEDMDQQMKNQQEENKKLLTEIFNLHTQLDNAIKETNKWKDIAIKMGDKK
ncbi:MAG: hypothetical protein GX682_03535 [Clostridiaceae bacterium]|nr:hypothetical protein [Clostridiaceae bacterium]